MFRDWHILFFIVLLVNPAELKRSGGSGGSSRGQSASRGQVASGGGFNQGNGGFNQGGGNFNQGGFRPQPNSPSGNFHPNPQQPHFGQPTNFNHGSQNNWRPVGTPKSSSSNFGKALLGGAAGALGAIVIYEGAKALIRSSSEPFSYQGRNYYWDQNYKGDRNQIQCSVPISQLQQDINKENSNSSTTTAPGNSTETTTVATASTTPSVAQNLGNLQFKDGSKPREITWGCRKGAEICCGMDCCSAPQPNSAHSSGHSSLATILLVILLIILIGGCCCCFIAYKMCRSAFDCIFPRDHNKQDNDYQQQGDYEQHPQNQQYPMQQYPSNYPPQPYHQNSHNVPYPNQFPSQQNYPNAYPPHPSY